MELIIKLKEEFKMAVMLITHDLGVVAETTNRVVVMYCGRIVESGGVKQIFENPRHPYTKGLLNSVPHLEQDEEQLRTIQGAVPSPFEMPAGCRLYPRCDNPPARCRDESPGLAQIEPGHMVSCLRSESLD
jgi:peptide/nickel transport system ATP-binding protein